MVKENDLYGMDPVYTSMFNNIAKHELVNYERGRSKDRGEVYSLAYATYNNINYFCSKDVMVDIVSKEIAELGEVNIITFDIVLFNAYVYYANKNIKDYTKGIKAFYKRFCIDVIKRYKLPITFSEYIKHNIS